MNPSFYRKDVALSFVKWMPIKNNIAQDDAEAIENWNFIPSIRTDVALEQRVNTEHGNIFIYNRHGAEAYGTNRKRCVCCHGNKIVLATIRCKELFCFHEYRKPEKAATRT